MHGFLLKTPAIDRPKPRALNRVCGGLALLCLLASGAGCATVAVAPVSAISQIVLTSPQSELRREAKAFCDQALSAGWAFEDDAMGQLAGAMLGPDAGPRAPTRTYSVRLTAEGLTGAERQSRARADAALLAKRVAGLNARAQSVLSDAANRPERDDVIAFERALVIAQQSRQSIAAVLGEGATDAAEQASDQAMLASIDEALERARIHAEDLSYARMEQTGT
jgi:hypothetical protein